MGTSTITFSTSFKDVARTQMATPKDIFVKKLSGHDYGRGDAMAFRNKKETFAVTFYNEINQIMRFERNESDGVYEDYVKLTKPMVRFEFLNPSLLANVEYNYLYDQHRKYDEAISKFDIFRYERLIGRISVIYKINKVKVTDESPSKSSSESEHDMSSLRSASLMPSLPVKDESSEDEKEMVVGQSEDQEEQGYESGQEYDYGGYDEDEGGSAGEES